MVAYHSRHSHSRIAEVDEPAPSAGSPNTPCDGSLVHLSGAMRAKPKLTWIKDREIDFGHRDQFCVAWHKHQDSRSGTSGPIRNLGRRGDMRQAQLTVATLLTSAVLWSAVLSTGDSYEASSAFFLAAAILLTATVAVVAIVAGASKWGHRLGLGLAATMIALGAFLPLTVPTVVAMLLAGIALIGLNASGVASLIRRRPAADGPPARAVVLSVALLTSPVLWTVLSPKGLSASAMIAIGVVWTALIIYSRAIPGALLVARYITPISLVTLAVIDRSFTGGLIGLTAVGLAALAWTVDARVAVHPLAEPGTTVPIPPELAPRDILDAAGLDDRGHRLEGHQ